MAIFDLGIEPEAYRSQGDRHKPMDVEGLALEFAKFEALYDNGNRQAYIWLYHTGYGEKLWTELVTLSGDYDSAWIAADEARSALYRHQLINV